MNKELFDSMQKQMSPSPQVRAELSEKLAQPVKKRPAAWKKYTAVAACAALVIGALGASRYPSWELILQNFRPSILETPLHSYVTVDDLTGYITENTTTETGGGDTGAIEVLPGPNTGDLPGGALAPSGALPGGAYIGDAPSQEEAVNAYQKLMDHFDGDYPDWYGGAYIDGSGYLVVQLVSDEDPGDKTLELQVLDWTDSDHIMFSSCKYSLAHLNHLMDQLNALPAERQDCHEFMAGWGINEEANRIELTLTEVNDPILIVLAELDPDDDAIYVRVGQRATADVGSEDVRTDTAATEDPAVHHKMPGGVTAPVPEDDADLIAVEPWVDEDLDGAHYDIRDLPEERKPAATDSVPEEDASSDTSSFTPAYNPDVGFIYPKE